MLLVQNKAIPKRFNMTKWLIMVVSIRTAISTLITSNMDNCIVRVRTQATSMERVAAVVIMALEQNTERDITTTTNTTTTTINTPTKDPTMGTIISREGSKWSDVILSDVIDFRQ
uniref:Secreted protein n=1 Tax=Anopheles stephensi TaxID=30069 RepID=A0A182Y2X9_ANOST